MLGFAAAAYALSDQDIVLHGLAVASYGLVIGAALFGRRLRPLEQLESAAASASGHTGVALNVDVDAHELASLRDAFNSYVEAHVKNLGHGKVAANWQLDGMRVAERWWFTS